MPFLNRDRPGRTCLPKKQLYVGIEPVLVF